LVATSPGDSVAQTAGVLASAQYSADPDLRCDLLEVKRVSGGTLMIRWLIANTSAKSGGLTGASGKTIRYSFSWDNVYFIDPAENKKYQFLTDSENNKILDIFEGDLAPGQQRLNWARFPHRQNRHRKSASGFRSVHRHLMTLPLPSEEASRDAARMGTDYRTNVARWSSVGAKIRA
jgi:hypothetical protein